MQLTAALIMVVLGLVPLVNGNCEAAIGSEESCDTPGTIAHCNTLSPRYDYGEIICKADCTWNATDCRGSASSPAKAVAVQKISTSLHRGSVPVKSDSITVVVWFNPTTVLPSGSTQSIAECGDSVIRIAAVEFNGFVYASIVEPIQLASSFECELNTWTHVAATYGEGLWTLYVNGINVGSKKANPPAAPCKWTLFGGTHYAYETYGYAADSFVMAKTLTQNDIITVARTGLYNALLPNVVIGYDTYHSAGLVNAVPEESVSFGWYTNKPLATARLTITGIPSCAKNCSGHGDCMPDGVCECHNGYSGSTCEMPCVGTANSVAQSHYDFRVQSYYRGTHIWILGEDGRHMPVFSSSPFTPMWGTSISQTLYITGCNAMAPMSIQQENANCGLFAIDVFQCSVKRSEVVPVLPLSRSIVNGSSLWKSQGRLLIAVSNGVHVVDCSLTTSTFIELPEFHQVLESETFTIFVQKSGRWFIHNLAKDFQPIFVQPPAASQPLYSIAPVMDGIVDYNNYAVVSSTLRYYFPLHSDSVEVWSVIEGAKLNCSSPNITDVFRVESIPFPDIGQGMIIRYAPIFYILMGTGNGHTYTLYSYSTDNKLQKIVGSLPQPTVGSDSHKVLDQGYLFYLTMGKTSVVSVDLKTGLATVSSVFGYNPIVLNDKVLSWVGNDQLYYQMHNSSTAHVFSAVPVDPNLLPFNPIGCDIDCTYAALPLATCSAVDACPRTRGRQS